jgi:S1-C subfamily serine protease
MHDLNKLYFLLCALIISMSSMASNAEVFERANSGVVLITGDEGFGSGALISSQGHILTNWHVVEGTEKLEVALHREYDLGDDIQKYFFEATVIKVNLEKDLALIKIINPPKDLNVLRISQVIPPIGSQVHAIGHPNTEFWSYTTGYISQMKNQYEWRYEEGGIDHVANVYLTQTPIDEGNSGGPLLNDHGNIIGINTFGSKKTSFQNYSVSAIEVIRFLASR